jgi:hypothetical protein
MYQYLNLDHYNHCISRLLRFYNRQSHARHCSHLCDPTENNSLVQEILSALAITVSILSETNMGWHCCAAVSAYDWSIRRT